MEFGCKILICVFIFGLFSVGSARSGCVDSNGENLCKNGGTCVGSSKRCSCGPAWAGRHCELARTHCYNGGTFTKDKGCVCLDDFRGRFCEEKCACQNGGKCTDGRCQCPIGYDGNDCQCEFPQMFERQTHQCSACADGYEGDTCSDIDECLTSPCLHGSTCENVDGSYHCTCPVGRAGRHCDVIVDTTKCDVTDTDSCGMGGICESFGDIHVCACKFGFYGEFCEDSIICEEHQRCSSSSQCLQSQDSYQCKCGDGYLGDHCQAMTSCSANVTCLHNGTCESCMTSSLCGGGDDVTDAFTCRCADGFHGANCEMRIENGRLVVVEQAGVDQSWAIYTAIACGVVLGLALIGLGVYKFTRRDRHQVYTTKPQTEITPGESETVKPISKMDIQTYANEAFNSGEDVVREV